MRLAGVHQPPKDDVIRHRRANLGPNLFVSGSLAWLLWFRAAKTAGAHPSFTQASRIGVIAVPLAMAAALGLLVLTGSS